MTIALTDNVLQIRELKNLTGAETDTFQDRVRAALPVSALKAVEIDLSQAHRLDSCGLGALLSVHRWATTRADNGSVSVRLLDPPPSIQHVLELTRLHRIFEIVKR